MSSRPSVAERRRNFHALHGSGCFLIPNPWDAGSARFLESLGFRALATTSSGFAWSQGRADGEVPLEAVLTHLALIVEATDLPVNADFQGGFEHEPHRVEQNVRAALDTGIAGLSIEDATSDPQHPLYDIELGVQRIRAARKAIDATGGDALLVARAEGFIAGRPDIEETIKRLTAYANAGADCLYAPGIRTAEDITRVVQSVAPKPVNLLGGPAIGLSVAEIAALGVRRISVGGALARVAWSAFMRAARQLAEDGRFDALAGAIGGDVLNAFMHESAAGSQ